VSDPAFRARTAARAREMTLGLALAPHPRGAGGLGGGGGGGGQNDAAAAAAAPLSFLGHAWGAVPPRALEQAVGDWAAMAALGNPAWDVALGQVVPEAARNVRRMLLADGGAEGEAEGGGGGGRSLSVQFAHNSHELVYRVLTSRMLLQKRGQGARRPRVLASDCEFYSLARQLNLLSSSSSSAAAAAAAPEGPSTAAPPPPLLDVLPPVPSEPAETFEARLIEAVRSAAASGEPVAAVCASAVTFLTQRVLVREPAALARRAAEASADGWRRWWRQENKGDEASPPPPFLDPPLVLVDAYHAFAALPIPPLDADADAPAGGPPENLILVAGLLKHAGCGPNAAFAALPPALAARLEPRNSGWLCDFAAHVSVRPTVAGAAAAAEGGEEEEGAPAAAPPPLGYGPGTELAGATPGYVLPLLVFNRSCALRRDIERQLEAPGALSVRRVHARVLALQRRLIDGLPADDGGAAAANSAPLPRSALLPATGSHTLVFRMASPEAARQSVAALAARGALVDCRGACVRVGLGAGHDDADVDALLAAAAAAARGE
jgi:hypothetical protein